MWYIIIRNAFKIGWSFLLVVFFSLLCIFFSFNALIFLKQFICLPLRVREPVLRQLMVQYSSFKNNFWRVQWKMAELYPVRKINNDILDTNSVHFFLCSEEEKVLLIFRECVFVCVPHTLPSFLIFNLHALSISERRGRRYDMCLVHFITPDGSSHTHKMFVSNAFQSPFLHKILPFICCHLKNLNFSFFKIYLKMDAMKTCASSTIYSVVILVLTTLLNGCCWCCYSLFSSTHFIINARCVCCWHVQCKAVGCATQFKIKANWKFSDRMYIMKIHITCTRTHTHPSILPIWSRTELIKSAGKIVDIYLYKFKCVRVWQIRITYRVEYLISLYFLSYLQITKIELGN